MKDKHRYMLAVPFGILVSVISAVIMNYRGVTFDLLTFGLISVIASISTWLLLLKPGELLEKSLKFFHSFEIKKSLSFLYSFEIKNFKDSFAGTIIGILKIFAFCFFGIFNIIKTIVLIMITPFLFFKQEDDRRFTYYLIFFFLLTTLNIFMVIHNYPYSLNENFSVGGSLLSVFLFLPVVCAVLSVFIFAGTLFTLWQYTYYYHFNKKGLKKINNSCYGSSLEILIGRFCLDWLCEYYEKDGRSPLHSVLYMVVIRFVNSLKTILWLTLLPIYLLFALTTFKRITAMIVSAVLSVSVVIFCQSNGWFNFSEINFYLSLAVAMLFGAILGCKLGELERFKIPKIKFLEHKILSAI